jgi:hypothetical protein
MTGCIRALSKLSSIPGKQNLSQLKPHGTYMLNWITNASASYQTRKFKGNIADREN